MRTKSGQRVGRRQTLLRGSIVDVEVKVVCLTEVIEENDVFLKIKHRDSSAIKCYTRLILLRFESVEHTRRHGLEFGIVVVVRRVIMTLLTNKLTKVVPLVQNSVHLQAKSMAQASGSATTNGELRQRKEPLENSAGAVTTSEEGRKKDKLLDQHQE